MKLKLVKLEDKYKDQLFEMMDEWYATGEQIVPYAIRVWDYHDFENYCKAIETSVARGDIVPCSTFFCLDMDRNIFVGAVNIRHYLNDKLLLSGGHIGDGVRPSERRKGIATQMIKLALEECRRLNIDRVLMTCEKTNIGSAKSIVNNGGILENEVNVDGVIEQRYWIQTENLKKREAKSRYEIDLQGVVTKGEFHDRIQESLPCPSYYGRNLDALYDMLTESPEERELVFLHYEEFARELPGYFASLRELCAGAMEERGNLKVLFAGSESNSTADLKD